MIFIMQNQYEHRYLSLKDGKLWKAKMNSRILSGMAHVHIRMGKGKWG